MQREHFRLRPVGANTLAPPTSPATVTEMRCKSNGPRHTPHSEQARRERLGPSPTALARPPGSPESTLKTAPILALLRQTPGCGEDLRQRPAWLNRASRCLFAEPGCDQIGPTQASAIPPGRAEAPVLLQHLGTTTRTRGACPVSRPKTLQISSFTAPRGMRIVSFRERISPTPIVTEIPCTTRELTPP